MPPKKFRVIIVGGGIAGLALAIMLEKNGIDYLVLEAYRDIAPQVGASIGLLPNGLRVLDQIGCYEDVMKMAETPVDRVYLRRSDGTVLKVADSLCENSTQRFVSLVFFGVP